MEPYLTLFKQERKTKEKQRIDKSRKHIPYRMRTPNNKKKTATARFFSFSLFFLWVCVCVVSFARVLVCDTECVFIQ